MNKILNDNIEKEKVFDLLFVIDATGSMHNYIRAAKDEAENISKELRSLYPEYRFKYGYIFYRDPIDNPTDIHEIIDFTDQVNTLPEKIQNIKATGGGDLPEDWVGAYKLVNEKINWRNGFKVIIHLADCGAHGNEFTLSDKYPLEGDKLKSELLKCCQKNIKIFGFVITEDARNSFNQCQNFYRSNGGSYEIYDLKIDKDYHDYYHDDDDMFYSSSIDEKRKDKKDKRRLDEKCDKDLEEYEFGYKGKIGGVPKFDYERDTFLYGSSRLSSYRASKQEIINHEFKTKVLESVKLALP